VDDGSGVTGEKSRTVDCKRSDGETVDDFFCIGERPHEYEACVLQHFYVMNSVGGLCLGPEGGATAAKHLEMAAHVEKCTGEKNKFKVESGQDGGFKLINVATGLCYCQKSTNSNKMFFREQCDGPGCELKKEDTLADGSFLLTPIGRKCIRTKSGKRPGNLKVRVTSTESDCSTDSSRFAFVKEGGVPISKYMASIAPDAPNPHGHKIHFPPIELFPGLSIPGFLPEARPPYFEDKSGKMLVDGELMKGDFPNSEHNQKGVGWLNEVSLDFTLAEPGPLQAINVGFTFKKDWQVKKPKTVEVQCSSDGTSWGNAARYHGSEIEVIPTDYYKRDKGGRKTLSFQVGDICGDDTTAYRVTVKPQAGDKEKKAVLDEIMAFAPFSFE